MLQTFLSVPNIFSDSPQHVRNSTSFRIILNTVLTVVDPPECPKYFFWLPKSSKKSNKVEKNFERSCKAHGTL